MRIAILLLAFGLCACDTTPEKTSAPNAIETTMAPDNARVDEGRPESEIDSPGVREAAVLPRTYGNERFRNVEVKRIADDTYRVTGEGQIFEANFGWVVEDGHNELAKGHQMTSAGAPEWGKFNFEVKAAKAQPNSTLHLILFESSAKDGSRQHQLPIPLQ